MKRKNQKKLVLGSLALIIVAVVTFTFTSSNDLMGRFSSPTIGTKEVPVKGDLRSITIDIDYEEEINELSSQVDELSIEFTNLKEDYYVALINLAGEASNYQEYEDAEEFRIETLDYFYEIENKFTDFFDSYESIDEDKLSVYEEAIFGDLKNKVTEDIAYIEATQEFTLENLYTLMIPSNIDYLEHIEFPTYGDLEILNIEVTVGADRELHFFLGVINNADESADETRSMPVGNIYLEGDYWTADAGSSYFGIEMSYDEEIESGDIAYVEGQLSFADRTEDIYRAYINGETLYFNVTGYVNYTHSTQEYDFDNNFTEEKFRAL